MSNNAVTICTENTECILVTSQEFESTEQDRTAICSSNIEKDKKKYDVDFEMENHRCCSFPMDNVSLQELDEGKTHSSSPSSTLSAIQVGKSWKFPANLMVLKFCVDYGKVFAVCHERHIHTGQPCISLYIHDVTSGNIHNVIPLFDHNIMVVDMCMVQLENRQCVAIGHTLRSTETSKDMDDWLVKFVNISGEENVNCGIVLGKTTFGPMCLFENKLLMYHSQHMCILILNTSKWPIERNEALFETGLEHDTGVVNMITCTGKTSHQRLVIIDYIRRYTTEVGVACFDIDGTKLWKVSQSDINTTFYPCADNKGHVFICHRCYGKVFFLKDNLYKKTLIHLSERIQLYCWSNTMDKMFIAHYTDTDILNMTCYDIIEQ